MGIILVTWRLNPPEDLRKQSGMKHNAMNS